MHLSRGAGTMISIGRALAELARRDPSRPLLTDATTTVTRDEFERRTNRLARAYAALGVGVADLVTIALPNGAAFYEAVMAAWKLGAVPQPISYRLPHRERQAVIDLAQPTLVVGSEHSGPARAISAGWEPDPRLDDTPLPDRVAPSWKAPTSGGSTGRPKLIVSTQPGLVELDRTPGYEMRPDGIQLVAGPLYHNGPFTYSMRGLLCGNHQVVMARFDPRQALELIERQRCDWTLLVPTMLGRIWALDADDRRRYDLSSLRAVLHLGAPCPQWLKRAWIEWLGADRVFELYAGTEAQVRTWITGREWLQRPGSVGRPLDGGRIRILDERGGEVSAGTVGEVYLRSAGAPTYRYVGAVARTAGDGWESLGDMGWVDDDGYLYLADRRNDVIVSGAANVYPAEVEAALSAHTAVISCAVVGLPDDDLGARVHAIVQVGEGVSESDLRRHLQEWLAPYKVPRSFEFTDTPLRDEAGKVRRGWLRAERLSVPADEVTP